MGDLELVIKVDLPVHTHLPGGDPRGDGTGSHIDVLTANLAVTRRVCEYLTQ